LEIKKNVKYSLSFIYSFNKLINFNNSKTSIKVTQNGENLYEETLQYVKYKEVMHSIIFETTSHDDIVITICHTHVIGDISIKSATLSEMKMAGAQTVISGDVGGEAIVIANVPRIIKKHKLVPKYDQKTQTPFVQLNVYEGGTSSYINGRVLEPGTYNIYYENENSIRAKLEIVNKYNILGTGLWALDNEDSDFWTYYKEALNAVPYETEDEVLLRNKMEYAARYIVVTNETELMPQASMNYTRNIKTNINYSIQTNSDVPSIFIALLGKELILPQEKKSKSIKIKRYYIDENNELKARETCLYFNTAHVEAISTRALVVA
jgi:hypothetical protein